MGEGAQCGLPNEFCFMDLKKGAKVIGFLCLLLSIVSSVLLLFYLFSDADEITKEIAGNDMHTKEKLDPHTSSTRTVAGLLLALSILYGIASIFLIKGSLDKTKKYIVPFLVITLVALISCIIISVTQYEKGNFYLMLTICVVLIYFFLCIYSLYKRFSVDY
jgi:hypothetical protein